jgi:RNA polymerase sigma-70 factor (ECF subfamily)
MGAEDGSNASISDSLLLTRICRRDEQALGLLYDRYGTLMYTIALHITQDRAVAEEVIQSVFQTAWQFAAGCQIQVSVSTWLITLTRQRAIDATQQNGYHIPDGAALLDSVPVAPTPKQTDQHAAALAVRTALHGLPAKQREAIELAYYRGLTRDEIAARLGRPCGIVDARLRASLSALHAWFYHGSEVSG